MTDDDWDDFFAAAREGACTPFLGAGASSPLPGGAELATMLAQRFNLLTGVEGGLSRVAQNVSLLPTARDLDSVKRFIRDECDRRAPPGFMPKSELHHALAELPLPFYITTNYDDFMCRALLAAHKKPLRELCQWHNAQWGGKAAPKSHSCEAHAGQPMVFHLHGAFDELRSMVLTDDEYLDFLTATSINRKLIPPPVEATFSNSRLIFLGYGLEDITFQVLLKRMGETVRRFERGHVTVQLPPPNGAGDPVTEQRYKIREAHIRRLLGSRAIIYSGTCEQFGAELAARWRSRS